MTDDGAKGGRFFARTGFWLTTALLWLLCGVWYFLPRQSGQVELWYSRGLFKSLAFLIVPLTDSLPFSLAITLLVAFPLVLAGVFVAEVISALRQKEKVTIRVLSRGIKILLFLLPFLWCWFLLFWGIGYGRDPMETRLHMDNEAVAESELLQIADTLYGVLTRDLPRDAEERNISRAVRSISYAMQRVVLRWEGRSAAVPRRVKATPPGLLLLNGTSGICSPYTLEAHVDGALPDTFFVAVAAHELGHIAGVCDEGETNLIGYAAGLQAENSYARYCVALDLYVNVARQLSPELRQAAMARLPQSALDDIRKAGEASRRYRIEFFHKWSWRMYNHYLKSQGVKDGVRSYGRGVQLVVKAWRAGMLPLAG